MRGVSSGAVGRAEAPSGEGEPGRPALIWVCCHVATGLERALKKRFRVHRGPAPPEGDDEPCCVVLCAEGEDGLPEGVRRVREPYPDVPVLVFGPRADLSLARAALKAGARGFVHAGLEPAQAMRAIEVALEGEIVAPRGLLEYVLADKKTVSPDLLSPRQLEILQLVAEGLTNAQIARRVFLSEFTVKQHLRNAYKLLGVKNRTEAVRSVRKRA